MFEGDGLKTLGARPDYGLTFAVDTAYVEKDNGHGVTGQRYEAIDGAEGDAAGAFAQHGGIGPRETAPFLVVDDGSGSGRERAETSSLPNIAPTILGYLGVAAEGLQPSLL